MGWWFCFQFSNLFCPALTISGLWLGSANGRPWQEKGGPEEREIAVFLPHIIPTSVLVSGNYYIFSAKWLLLLFQPRGCYQPSVARSLLLLEKKWVLVAQSCPVLCPPGSSVHGISQARILEWIAIFFSRGSSQPRNWTQVSCITCRFFTVWATREAPVASPILSYSSP